MERISDGHMRPSEPTRLLTEKVSAHYNLLTQQRVLVNSGSADLTKKMDDDHQEIFTAIEDAKNARSLAWSTPFWKEMEPYFKCVT